MYEASSLPASFEDGAVLLIDKPKGATSFDVVKAVRGRVGPSKVGHAGTLDPLATGLLIILVARPATRLQEAFMHLPKVYEGTMRLGEVTPSLDVETEVVERTDVSHLTLDAAHIVINGRPSDALFLAWPVVISPDPLALPPLAFVSYYLWSPSFFIEVLVWLAVGALVVQSLRNNTVAGHADS